MATPCPTCGQMVSDVSKGKMARKYDYDKIKDLLKRRPNMTLRAVARHIGCSVSVVKLAQAEMIGEENLKKSEVRYGAIK